jgi:nucleoside-diphosphate-sugar epimerase
MAQDKAAETVVRRATRYFRARLSRGLSLKALGPTESRIVFDFAAGWAALAAAVLFHLVFVPSRVPGRACLPFLPVAFLAANTAFGIYTSLLGAAIRTKLAALLGSTLCVVALARLCGAPWDIIALWAILTVPPTMLARVFLGLPYSRHKNLTYLASNQRGSVLVIGGAGYIGSSTVELLLKQGFRVRVLDRLMYGRDSLAEFAHHPFFELIEGDVTDIAKLTFAARNASAVVHLAGLVGDPACALDAQFTRHANVVATRMAKDVAVSLGVPRFIFASSCSVYGVSDREVGETDRLNPVSLYAQTKIDSEEELLWNLPDRFFVTILRFATVFGHSRRPRFDLVANFFAARALADGVIPVLGPQQRRPFIHVKDLARAIVAALRADPYTMQSQIFNVGDRRLNMSIMELAQAVQRVVQPYRAVEITVNANPGDLRSYAVSFEKIRHELGFEASTLMEEGLTEIVANLRAGRYRDYRDPTYSNVLTTSKALADFYSPDEMARLYGPLVDRQPKTAKSNA